MDFRHVVFPEPRTDLYHFRQQRVAKTLNEIQAALGREKRDLEREAEGCEPIEGVGVEVVNAQANVSQMADEPSNSSMAVG